jgi:zinc and cadmium transporter
MNLWLYTLASVGLVSAIPLAVIFTLPRDLPRLRRIVPLLVSFAVGGMLGGAFLHLIPEAVARLGAGMGMSLYLLLGFVGFFVLEKWLGAHRHEPAEDERAAPMATLNLVGDGVHNFIDGMVIAAAFSADNTLGLATTLAVILHELPQEIGDFGILLYSGLPYRRAVRLNLLSGLSALAGAVLTLVIGARIAGFAQVLLPFAAGNFIYIAAADLVPELHRARGLATAARQIALLLLGIGLMVLTAAVE